MSKSIGHGCKAPITIALDNAAGDAVLVESGVVLGSRSVEETYGWLRPCVNESSDQDPAKLEGPSNLLLNDDGLLTMITKANKAEFPALRGLQSRSFNSDHSLLIACQAISEMADRLGLVTTIKEQANEIYKKIEDLKSVRGKSQGPIVAACLYIACRQQGKPHTFKEICSVANGTSKKEIGRALKFIAIQLEKKLGMSMEMGAIHPGDFLRRFCSQLGLNNQVIKAATESVKRSEILDIRKSPISIAAAAIYMVSQLSEEKKALKDIARVAGVAEITIKNSYKDLYPHASQLIPDWFLKLEDLNKLSEP